MDRRQGAKEPGDCGVKESDSRPHEQLEEPYESVGGSSFVYKFPILGGGKRRNVLFWTLAGQRGGKVKTRN